MNNRNVVYIVHCVDTEGPLREPIEETFVRINQIFGLNIEPSIENLKKIQQGAIDFGNATAALTKLVDPKLISFNESWDDIGRMLKTICSLRFRREHGDSSGSGWLYNWFCLDHVGYDYNPRGRCLGHHKVYDYYLMNCSGQSNVRDRVYFHYHPLPYNRMAHSCATNYLNDNHLFEILARKVIDRQWFPAVFRPGFHTIRPDSHWFLEQWIPFDYSNQATEAETDQPDLGDGRFGDWRQAPRRWGGYHPSHDDYQAEGDCRRLIFRCLNMRARLRELSQSDVDDAFQQASLSGKAVLAFTNHDFRDMASEISSVYQKIKKSALRWPDVEFRHCNALEAARCYLDGGSPEPLGLELVIREKSAGDAELNVTTHSRLFGPQPFLAIKTVEGSYYYDNFDLGSQPNSWKYTFDWQTFTLKRLEKVGVAATGRQGQMEIAVWDRASNTVDIKKIQYNS